MTELIQNGSFSDASIWLRARDVNIANGVATCVNYGDIDVVDGYVQQTISVQLVTGKRYSTSVGSIVASIDSDPLHPTAHGRANFQLILIQPGGQQNVLVNRSYGVSSNDSVADIDISSYVTVTGYYQVRYYLSVSRGNYLGQDYYGGEIDIDNVSLQSLPSLQDTNEDVTLNESFESVVKKSASEGVSFSENVATERVYIQATKTVQESIGFGEGLSFYSNVFEAGSGNDMVNFTEDIFWVWCGDLNEEIKLKEAIYAEWKDNNLLRKIGVKYYDIWVDSLSKVITTWTEDIVEESIDKS